MKLQVPPLPMDNPEVLRGRGQETLAKRTFHGIYKLFSPEVQPKRRDRLKYNVLSGLRPSPELTYNVVDNTLSLFRRKGICLCNYIWLTQEMGKPFVDKD